MRKRPYGPVVALLVASVATFALVGFAVADGEGSHPVPPPNSSEREELRAAALAFAASNGDANPSEALLVGASRKSVVAATMGGAEVDTDQDVYAVRLRGRFVAYGVSVPRGMPLPRGQFLLLVYDAATTELTDWNLSSQPQNVSQFGQPEPLAP